MNNARYQELDDDPNARLTKEECREGWHFCPDWDFLLIRLGDPEGEQCGCKPWTEEQIAEVTT